MTSAGGRGCRRPRSSRIRRLWQRMGWPAVAIDELGLERREEALGERVVVGRPGRAHRGGDTGLGKPGAEGDARVLGAAIGVMDETGPGARRPIAASSAPSTSSVRRWPAIDQPTTRRLKASTMAARYRKPASSAGT